MAIGAKGLSSALSPTYSAKQRRESACQGRAATDPRMGVEQRERSASITRVGALQTHPKVRLNGPGRLPAS
jgi:hypothetical protein